MIVVETRQKGKTRNEVSQRQPNESSAKDDDEEEQDKNNIEYH
jgi:hypothetical protein